MLGIVKITAISALLSFGTVQLMEQASPPASEGKLYADRLPSEGAEPVSTSAVSSRIVPAEAPALTRAAKGDRLAAAQDCRDQTWPYYDARCLQSAGTAASQVRVITIETREGNTSTLRRVAQTTVAQR